MSQYLGIDYGAKRLGIATASPQVRIAFAAPYIRGQGAIGKDAESVAQWARSNDISTIVIGLPLNMDGSEGPQAIISRQFAEALAVLGDWRVQLWDERLTSTQASNRLAERGINKRLQAGKLDSAAAQIILQAYLDAERNDC
jgi:putative Holliday junction resolvase